MRKYAENMRKYAERIFPPCLCVPPSMMQQHQHSLHHHLQPLLPLERAISSRRDVFATTRCVFALGLEAWLASLRITEYYGYYGILRNWLLRNITEYYGRNIHLSLDQSEGRTSRLFRRQP